MVAYSFKKRFIGPILLGLGEILPLPGLVIPAGQEIRPKRQTIRAVGKKRHASVGEDVQLYTAMRTKQCRKLGEARCVVVAGVLLKWSEWPSFCTFELAGGKRVGPLVEISDMESFARDDGFVDLAAMREFWQDEHGGATFEGLLIKWEPIA